MFKEIDDLAVMIYQQNDFLQRREQTMYGNYTSSVLSFKLKPTKLSKITSSVPVICTELYGRYRLEDSTIKQIDEYFIGKMAGLGYKLLLNRASTSMFNGNLNYNHYMLFEFPINKRVTRPSMRTLLKLN